MNKLINWCTYFVLTENLFTPFVGGLYTKERKVSFLRKCGASLVGKKITKIWYQVDIGQISTVNM